jgi:hypothetical protein
MAVGMRMASVGTVVLLAPGAFILSRRSCLTKSSWVGFDRTLEGFLCIVAVAFLEGVECLCRILVRGSKCLEF